jgi:hypothetical protein
MGHMNRFEQEQLRTRAEQALQAVKSSGSIDDTSSSGGGNSSNNSSRNSGGAKETTETTQGDGDDAARRTARPQFGTTDYQAVCAEVRASFSLAWGWAVQDTCCLGA